MAFKPEGVHLRPGELSATANWTSTSFVSVEDCGPGDELVAPRSVLPVDGDPMSSADSLHLVLAMRGRSSIFERRDVRFPKPGIAS